MFHGFVVILFLLVRILTIRKTVVVESWVLCATFFVLLDSCWDFVRRFRVAMRVILLHLLDHGSYRAYRLLGSGQIALSRLDA